MALGLRTVLGAGEGTASTPEKGNPASRPAKDRDAEAERDPKRAPPAGPPALHRDQGLR